MHTNAHGAKRLRHSPREGSVPMKERPAHTCAVMRDKGPWNERIKGAPWASEHGQPCSPRRLIKIAVVFCGIFHQRCMAFEIISCWLPSKLLYYFSTDSLSPKDFVLFTPIHVPLLVIYLFFAVYRNNTQFYSWNSSCVILYMATYKHRWLGIFLILVVPWNIYTRILVTCLHKCFASRWEYSGDQLISFVNRLPFICSINFSSFPVSRILVILKSRVSYVDYI